MWNLRSQLPIQCPTNQVPVPLVAQCFWSWDPFWWNASKTTVPAWEHPGPHHMSACPLSHKKTRPVSISSGGKKARRRIILEELGRGVFINLFKKDNVGIGATMSCWFPIIAVCRMESFFCILHDFLLQSRVISYPPFRLQSRNRSNFNVITIPCHILLTHCWRVFLKYKHTPQDVRQLG